MPFATVPPPTPIVHETRATRDVCIAGAARHYGTREDLIRALIRTEGGTTGEIRRNSDGSYDMGLMQINSIHLGDLGKYGIGPKDLIYNECLNIYIGTWYVQSRILRRGDVWKGIGDYRSRTPSINADYQWRVYKSLMSVWSSARPR